MNIYQNLQNFYDSPSFNGYDSHGEIKRFNILNDYQFTSVLDVGSGPCFLKQWLSENEITCTYEAVDIRQDSLSLCNCSTYEEIPLSNSYELVCIFETVSYNIDFDENKNKQIFIDLLTKSKQVASKYVIFSVFNENKKEEFFITNKDELVWFSPEEINSILQSIGFNNYQIIERNDLQAYCYYVVCNLL